MPRNRPGMSPLRVTRGVAYALNQKQEAHALAHAVKTSSAKAAKEATKASKHHDTQASTDSPAKKNSAAERTQGGASSSSASLQGATRQAPRCHR